MSEPASPASSSSVTSAPAARLQLVRLPVDKPQPAVTFLHARSRGVMDLIAHFWEGLARTPPLLRADLHLVVAAPIDDSLHLNSNTPPLDPGQFSGAMLYVPKAHRADVLALDAATAAAFAAYISHQGARGLRGDGVSNASMNGSPAAANGSGTPVAAHLPNGTGTSGTADSTVDSGINNSGEETYELPPMLPLTDLSVTPKNGAAADATELPAEPQATPKGTNGAVGARVPIDFLTGDAEGIGWLTPLLLPLVHKRAPARQLINVVMQLPPEVAAEAEPNVRLAREADVPQLNRWRRLYKEERGIVFDADMGALIDHQRVFVCEVEKQIVAVAKIDLELQTLVEIGGVYTFPEFRKRGYGAGIVRDLAARIRQQGKVPTLQVDVDNTPALQLYEKAGWKRMGKLARVWLTG